MIKTFVCLFVHAGFAFWSSFSQAGSIDLFQQLIHFALPLAAAHAVSRLALSFAAPLQQQQQQHLQQPPAAAKASALHPSITVTPLISDWARAFCSVSFGAKTKVRRMGKRTVRKSFMIT